MIFRKEWLMGVALIFMLSGQSHAGSWLESSDGSCSGSCIASSKAKKLGGGNNTAVAKRLIEYSKLSEAAYDTGLKVKGWTEVDGATYAQIELGTGVGNSKGLSTGLAYRVFEKGDSVVVSFRGTTKEEKLLAENKDPSFYGAVSSPHALNGSKVVDFLFKGNRNKDIDPLYASDEIIVTGHSKGGAIANYIGTINDVEKTGIRVVAFNSTQSTKWGDTSLLGYDSKNSGNIVNVRVTGDPGAIATLGDTPGQLYKVSYWKKVNLHSLPTMIAALKNAVKQGEKVIISQENNELHDRLLAIANQRLGCLSSQNLNAGMGSSLCGSRWVRDNQNRDVKTRRIDDSGDY